MTENDKLTEEKIFESATEVFLRKGMDGARMQDIANHAGINKSLLHYYFRPKEHLFNAVFEKIASQMFARFAPIFDENISFEDKIRFFLREHISFMQKNPRLPSFILYEMHRNPERIKKLVRSLDIHALWDTLEKQHHDDLIRYHITPEILPQLMTSIASMSVFPFVGKSIISAIMEQMGYDWDVYIEERKTYAGDFVIHALKNQASEK